MKTEKKKALKKIYKAIDALIYVQDLGEGCEAITRSLDNLNSMAQRLDNEIERMSGIGLLR